MLRYRLSFTLPRALRARNMPLAQIDGMKLEIQRGERVNLDGPSRERTHEVASRLLRRLWETRGCPLDIVIPAVSFTTDPTRIGCGQDNWHIIVGPDVIFTAGGIKPTIFAGSTDRTSEKQALLG